MKLVLGIPSKALLKQGARVSRGTSSVSRILESNKDVNSVGARFNFLFVFLGSIK